MVPTTAVILREEAGAFASAIPSSKAKTRTAQTETMRNCIWALVGTQSPTAELQAQQNS